MRDIRRDYKKGIEEISHRDPDLQKITEYKLCMLGFARLSIMDLSDRAMQPFASNDGMVALLFNGEIYIISLCIIRFWEKHLRMLLEIWKRVFRESEERCMSSIQDRIAVKCW